MSLFELLRIPAPVVAALYLIGTALVLAYFVKGDVGPLKIPQLEPSRRRAAAACGAALVLVCVFAGLPLFLVGGKAAHGPRASIDAPSAGMEIPRKIEIRGHAEPARPDSGSYWIIVRDDDGHDYPQAKLAVTMDGVWRHRLILGESWGGRSMNVMIAYSGSAQEDAILEASIGSSDMTEIPSDVAILETVTLHVNKVVSRSRRRLASVTVSGARTPPRERRVRAAPSADLSQGGLAASDGSEPGPDIAPDQ